MTQSRLTDEDRRLIFILAEQWALHARNGDQERARMARQELGRQLERRTHNFITTPYSQPA